MDQEEHEKVEKAEANGDLVGQRTKPFAYANDIRSSSSSTFQAEHLLHPRKHRRKKLTNDEKDL